MECSGVWKFKLAKEWLKWIAQLWSVKVPRSLVRLCNKVKSIDLHLLPLKQATKVACSAVIIALVKQDTGTMQGLLTLKSRISKRNTTIPRLELVAGHLAANMANNFFIAMRTRPKVMKSDNASVFKSTATWMKNFRNSEMLQDYLARQDINWQFNLSRYPWWGGMYERLIKDMKKTLHRRSGSTSRRIWTTGPYNLPWQCWRGGTGV